MTLAELDAVWAVLVTTCGANTDDPGFRVHWPYCGEYRFGGDLGSGGKVWAPTRDLAPRVTCYPEDATNQRVKKIHKANKRLGLIFDREWLDAYWRRMNTREVQ